MTTTSKLGIGVTCDDKGRVHVRGELDWGDTLETPVKHGHVFTVNPLMLTHCGGPMDPPGPNACPPPGLIIELRRDSLGGYTLHDVRVGGKDGPGPDIPGPKVTTRPPDAKP